MRLALNPDYLNCAYSQLNFKQFTRWRASSGTKCDEGVSIQQMDLIIRNIFFEISEITQYALKPANVNP
jgi:hypothetical protein